jgi:hypothetical protein
MKLVLGIYNLAQIHGSVATLRIVGDDLIPSEISALLGCNPSSEQRKGQIIVGEKTGQKRVARIGMWRLYAIDCEPENLDEQILELLGKLSNDLTVWQSLSEKFEIDLFCGLFMEKSNEGMEISPSQLKMLGERGINLSLDIYDGNDDSPFYSDLCPCESGNIYGKCCGKNFA